VSSSPLEVTIQTLFVVCSSGGRPDFSAAQASLRLLVGPRRGMMQGAGSPKGRDSDDTPKEEAGEEEREQEGSREQGEGEGEQSPPRKKSKAPARGASQCTKVARGLHKVMIQTMKQLRMIASAPIRKVGICKLRSSAQTDCYA